MATKNEWGDIAVEEPLKNEWGDIAVEEAAQPATAPVPGVTAQDAKTPPPVSNDTRQPPTAGGAGSAAPPSVQPSAATTPAPPAAKVFPTNHPNVKNDDGSTSNVILAGVNINGQERVIPTMVDGKKLSVKEATTIAIKNGIDKYPTFNTPEEGDAWAKANHGNIDEQGNLKTAAAPATAKKPLIPLDDPTKIAPQDMEDASKGFQGLADIVTHGVIPGTEPVIENTWGDRFQQIIHNDWKYPTETRKKIHKEASDKYVAGRQELVDKYGLKPDEVDDVVKHLVDQQPDDVSTDALGQVHYKRSVIGKNPDEIIAAIAKSNLPQDEKKRQIELVPQRVQRYKSAIVADVKQNRPELAEYLGLTGDDKKNWQKIDAALNTNAASQGTFGLAKELVQKGTKELSHVMGLFQDKIYEPPATETGPNAGTIPAGSFEKNAQEIAKHEKISKDLQDLSHEINKKKVEIWGQNAAVYGEGAGALAKMMLLGKVGGELAELAVPATRIAEAEKAAKVGWKALKGALSEVPMAATLATEGYNNTYDEAIKAGKTPDEASGLAAITATIHMVAWPLGGATGHAGVSDVFKKLGTAEIKDKAATTLARAITDCAAGTTKMTIDTTAKMLAVQALDAVAVQAKINPEMTEDQFKESLLSTLKSMGVISFFTGGISEGFKAKERGVAPKSQPTTPDVKDTQGTPGQEAVAEAARPAPADAVPSGDVGGGAGGAGGGAGPGGPDAGGPTTGIAPTGSKPVVDAPPATSIEEVRAKAAARAAELAAAVPAAPAADATPEAKQAHADVVEEAEKARLLAAGAQIAAETQQRAVETGEGLQSAQAAADAVAAAVPGAATTPTEAPDMAAAIPTAARIPSDAKADTKPAAAAAALAAGQSLNTVQGKKGNDTNGKPIIRYQERGLAATTPDMDAVPPEYFDLPKGTQVKTYGYSEGFTIDRRIPKPDGEYVKEDNPNESYYAVTSYSKRAMVLRSSDIKEAKPETKPSPAAATATGVEVAAETKPETKGTVTVPDNHAPKLAEPESSDAVGKLTDSGVHVVYAKDRPEAVEKHGAVPNDRTTTPIAKAVTDENGNRKMILFPDFFKKSDAERAEAINHERIHFEQHGFEKTEEGGKLATEAEQTLDPKSPTYDAKLDKLMGKEYPSWGKLTLRQKLREATRAGIQALNTGKTSHFSKGLFSYIKAFLNHVAKIHESDSAMSRYIKGVRERMADTAPAAEAPKPTQAERNAENAKARAAKVAAREAKKEGEPEGKVTYRAPAGGAKSKWVKVNGEWYRSDSAWKPKGKPLEPMGLRDALEKQLARESGTPPPAPAAEPQPVAKEDAEAVETVPDTAVKSIDDIPDEILVMAKAVADGRAPIETFAAAVRGEITALVPMVKNLENLGVGSEAANAKYLRAQLKEKETEAEPVETVTAPAPAAKPGPAAETASEAKRDAYKPGPEAQAILDGRESPDDIEREKQRNAPLDDDAFGGKNYPLSKQKQKPHPPTAPVTEASHGKLAAASYTDAEGNNSFGKDHIEAAKNANPPVIAPKDREARETPEYGFSTTKGQIVTREEAAKLAAESGTLKPGAEIERGQLHSDQTELADHPENPPRGGRNDAAAESASGDPELDAHVDEILKSTSKENAEMRNRLRRADYENKAHHNVKETRAEYLRRIICG